MSKKKKELSFFLAEYDILLEELPIYGGRMLLMRGGDFMVTYEAVSAFASVGLLVIAVITLLLNDKR